MMQSALPSSRQTCFADMVFPDWSNHYGTLFGGTALGLMSNAAFVAASRHARCAVVMATSDKVDFHSPVAAGQLVELTAHMARVGLTSMTVEVEVIAEILTSSERRLAMRGRFEIVAVDAAGLPIPIKLKLPI